MMLNEQCMCVSLLSRVFLLAGTAPKSPFSFFPGEGGEARRTITSWLDHVKSESPLDLTPDVAIETGVFKVCDLSNIQLHTVCSTCAGSGQCFAPLTCTLQVLSDFVGKVIGFGLRLNIRGD